MISFYVLMVLIALAVFWRPVMAVSTLLCVYGIEQWFQSQNSVFVFKSYLINICIILLLCLAAVIEIVKRNRSREKAYPRVAFVVILLFLYAFFTTLFTPESVKVYSLWYAAIPYVFAHLLVAPLLINKIEDGRQLFMGLIVISAIFSLLLLGFATWNNRRIVLLLGLEGNPLMIAQMIGYAALAALFYKSYRYNVLWRLVGFSVAALAIIVIVKSGSRGQLMALFISSFLTWALINTKIRLTHIFTALFSMALVVLGIEWALSEFWSESTSARWTAEGIKDSYGGRWEMARVLLFEWINSPLAVIGLGNSASYSRDIIGIYPHIVPVEILGEEGVIGFALYVYILWLWFKSAKVGIELTEHNAVHRAVFAIFIGFTIYSFLLTLKQGSLLLNTEFFMLVILVSKLANKLKLSRAALIHARTGA